MLASGAKSLRLGGNAGILGVRVEINHSNCKQLLQTHHFYPACPAVPHEILTPLNLSIFRLTGVATQTPKGDFTGAIISIGADSLSSNGDDFVIVDKDIV